MPKKVRKPTNAASRTYTIKEVAAILNVGLNEAYAAARRGELPIVKIGRSIRVLKPAFDRLMEGDSGTPQAS